MKRILTILAAIICLCSCEKENAQKHEWLSRTWVGEYETKVQSNDTGEYTTVTAGITLEFSDDKSVCIVRTSYSGLLSMKDFVAKFTTGPAEVLGFENYDLRIGNPADITVIDLEKKIKVDVTKFHSKSSNSPYDGMEFVGGPVMTIVDGNIVASFLSK